MPYYGFYVEDKWQIRSNWTLSAGLRYDLGRQTYSGNRYGNAVLDTSYPGWQLAIPGRAAGLDLHYLGADKNNFAPRVSLAYEPRPGWLLRGGYGIFYDLGVSNIAGSRLDSAFGGVPGYVGDFYDNSRFDVPDDEPLMGIDNVFPQSASLTVGTYPISTGTGTGYFDYQADIRFLDQDSGTTPYYHRFVVATEHQIGPRTAISVFYSGSRGRQLPYYDNVNKPAYQVGWTSDEEFNDARPNNNGRFGDVRVLRHGLTSTYNAGTIRIDQRMSHGLQFLSHYTYSKTITDRGSLDGAIDEQPPTWDWNRQFGRGEAVFSHPHRLIGAATWDIPYGESLKGLTRGLLWGWRASGVYVVGIRRRPDRDQRPEQRARLRARHAERRRGSERWTAHDARVVRHGGLRRSGAGCERRRPSRRRAGPGRQQPRSVAWQDVRRHEHEAAVPRRHV